MLKILNGGYIVTIVRISFLFSFLCCVGLFCNNGGVGYASSAWAAEPVADHGKEGEGNNPSYVKLDPLVVPIVNDDGASQVVSLLITLEVMAATDIPKIETLKPRVKDAMIINLYGLLNERAAVQNGVLQVSYVKKHLTAAIEKVVGEGVLKDVLLQMVQQNPV